jgi:DNA-binding MarR family transcriptional regulator
MIGGGRFEPDRVAVKKRTLVPKTTAAPPKVGVGRLLRTASTAFNRAFKMQLVPLGISYGQFQYLQSLWEADGLTQTELTRKVGVELASSTAVLDSLDQRGLIKRIRNSTDRRKIHVYLTAEGAALETDLMACAIATNAIARRGISNAEVSSLFDILGRLIDNINAAGDNERQAAPLKSPRRANRAVSHVPKAARQSMPRHS